MSSGEVASPEVERDSEFFTTVFDRADMDNPTSEPEMSNLDRQLSGDSLDNDYMMDDDVSQASSISTATRRMRGPRKSHGLLQRMTSMTIKDQSNYPIFTERGGRFKIVIYPQEEGDPSFVWRHGAETDIQGWAQRRSRWRDAWKARFFTLQGHRLFYAASEQHHPHGLIDLSRCTRLLVNSKPSRLEIVMQYQVKRPGSVSNLDEAFYKRRPQDELEESKGNPINSKTRVFYMRFDDLEDLRRWEHAFSRVVLERDGLDGEVQMPHDGPAFLNDEDVLREGYARKLNVSSALKSWTLRYMYLTPTKLVWTTDQGGEESKGEFVLSSSKTMRILAPDVEEDDMEEKDGGGARIVNVTIQVPEQAGPQKMVKGTVMTSTGPHEVLVRIPDGAEPGSIVTVQVVVQFSPGQLDMNALANDRQITVSVGDSFITMEFISKKEALVWAREIRDTVKRLDEDKLHRHIRNHEQYQASPRANLRKSGSGGRGLMERSRSHRGGRRSTGRVSPRGGSRSNMDDISQSGI
uniref:PH domain-containing protein n=2 Tax=Pinguiococcus pyrenoidosus TaxID=172671 RepID=A0A7R9UG61_9STRA|mmetsp:Transcript_9629/g.36126  ORF Transcript_9629/g.36126 Transcript_9629/m.36126 type:complete len:522 (+) Transcript_9629:266-1831(+)